MPEKYYESEERLSFAPEVMQRGGKCDLAVQVGGGYEVSRNDAIYTAHVDSLNAEATGLSLEVFQIPPLTHIDGLRSYREVPLPDIILTELEWLDENTFRFVAQNTKDPTMLAEDLLFTYGFKKLFYYKSNFIIDKLDNSRYDNDHVTCQNVAKGIECIVDVSDLEVRSELWLQFNKMLTE